MKTNVFSTNTQLRFVSVILKCVLGNPHLSQNISKVGGGQKIPNKNEVLLNEWPHIELSPSQLEIESMKQPKFVNLNTYNKSRKSVDLLGWCEGT